MYDAAGTPIPGVPIGYRLSDPSRGSIVYPTPYSAILTAALSILDSAWVVAETPMHLKDSTQLHLVPPGTIRTVVISPRVDTIANGTTWQYSTVAQDALGKVINVTFSWSSTLPTIATVSSAGLATAVAGDSTKIIASVGGVADTARLYVRALRTIKVSPADTVITAVGDSLLLAGAAFDNFGRSVTSGLNLRFSSASPSIAVVNRLTGRVKITGPGSAVVLANDSVPNSDSLMQGAATLRVNQVTAGIVTSPKVDSVGLGGQGQVLVRAIDANGYAITGKSFGWVARPDSIQRTILSVSSTGVVTGSQLGSAYVVASLVEAAKTFFDSTKVVLSATPLSGALVLMVTGNKFSPSAVTIKAGQYVTWGNNDVMIHTTTSDAPSPQQWNSGAMATGAVFSMYFSTPWYVRLPLHLSRRSGDDRDGHGPVSALARGAWPLDFAPTGEG